MVNGLSRRNGAGQRIPANHVVKETGTTIKALGSLVAQSRRTLTDFQERCHGFRILDRFHSSKIQDIFQRDARSDFRSGNRSLTDEDDRPLLDRKSCAKHLGSQITLEKSTEKVPGLAG
jgi:hypothetical protein